MTTLAAFLFLALVAVVLYYARLHFAWRAEVRRRRHERELERKQAGYRSYRTYSLDSE
jgi:hypothetical protein